jgi:hypothetical protein
MIQTPREIIQSALLSMGADGLCNPGCDCGCPLAELAPVGDCLDLDECMPARFVPPDAPGADLNILQQWPEGYYVPMEARP